MTVLAGLLLVRVFASDTISLRRAILAGIAVGLVTLVRPLTLVLPPFLALAMILQVGKAKSSRAWLAWAVFSLSMAVIIAPRTWSNYTRTGRFVPVNALFYSQLWPMFEVPIHPTSENYPWIALVLNRLPPIVKKAIGPANFAEEGDGMTHPFIMEKICHDRIRELIRTQPGVYFSNLAHNVLFFATGDSRLRIKAFVFCQYQDRYVHPITWATGFFIGSSALFHMCGMVGLALGLWRRDPTVTILASLFICLWVVHSMVYLDYRYLYVELPFMLWFTGYLFNEYFKTRGSDERPMVWLSTAFAISSLLGTALLVF
jgi:hypothetical protein